MDETHSPRQDVALQTPRSRGSIHARVSVRAWLLLIVTIAAGLAADLLTKQAAFEKVHDWPIVLDREALLNDPRLDPTVNTSQVTVLPGDLLGFRLALNRGAVLGLGANQRWFFLAFTVAAVMGGIWVFWRKTRAKHWAAHLGIGLLLAGALGNFYDRAALGAVRDFIQFMPGRRLPDGWVWPGGNPELMPWVFNVADVLLVVGVAILMVHVRRRRIIRKNKRLMRLASAAE